MNTKRFQTGRQWSLPYAGGKSVQLLQGPSGNMATINGGVTEFTWETPDRAVHELEVRMLLVGCNAVIGTRPLVRWSMVIGHGDNQLKEPTESFQIVSGSAVAEYTLPARGLVARISARNFRLYVRLAGLTTGPGPANFAGQLAVSVQPVVSSRVPDFPYQVESFPPGRNPIPQYAREWMVSSELGLPFAAAACTVVPVGSAGALMGLIDAVNLANWRPVPHDATTYQVSDPCIVSFR